MKCLQNNTRFFHRGSPQGTSFLPMYLLGLKKRYTFALYTGNDLWDKVGIQYDNFLENFRDR
jgi:hypothetical protein